MSPDRGVFAGRSSKDLADDHAFRVGANLPGSRQWVMEEERQGRLRRPAASITADLPALAEQRDGGGCWPTTLPGTQWCTRPTWCTPRWTTPTWTEPSGCPPTSGTSAPVCRLTGAGRTTGTTATVTDPAGSARHPPRPGRADRMSAGPRAVKPNVGRPGRATRGLPPRGVDEPDTRSRVGPRSHAPSGRRSRP